MGCIIITFFGGGGVGGTIIHMDPWGRGRERAVVVQALFVFLGGTIIINV